MRLRVLSMLFFLGIALPAASCGQDEVEFPVSKNGAEARCGDWYPGWGDDTDSAAGDIYGVTEGKTFDCAVWRSVQLGGEPTYLNFGELHLAHAYGRSPYDSVVIIVSAEDCPSCSLLIRAMVERAEEFEEAGAMMIGMARRRLGAPAGAADFDLEKAVRVLEEERWPTDVWYATNDPEHVLDQSFDEFTPWVIIINLEDMSVRVAANNRFAAGPGGVSQMLALLEEISGQKDTANRMITDNAIPTFLSPGYM